MKHMEFGGLEDDYFFELPRGEVTLSVGHKASPMGGNQVRLSLEGPGMTSSVLRPSDLGLVGFDGLWEAGMSQAYGVTDQTVTKLVDALQKMEKGKTGQPV